VGNGDLWRHVRHRSVLPNPRRGNPRDRCNYHARMLPQPQAELQHVPGRWIAPRAEFVAECTVMLRATQTLWLFSRVAKSERAIRPGQGAARCLILRLTPRRCSGQYPALTLDHDIAGVGRRRDEGKASTGPETAQLLAISLNTCESAWNKDPVLGVIGIQSGPPGRRVHNGFHGDMAARWGMLIVETIAKVRRAYFIDKKPIKAICREFRLSRRVVRTEATEFRYGAAGSRCRGLIRGGSSLTRCCWRTLRGRRASDLR
jgi:hypothetical protein